MHRMLLEPHRVGRILLIATRQIGDVLLVTPLLASLRQAYPESVIDVLVFRGTAGILEGNPHLTGVLEVSERPSRQEYRDLLSRIFRRYDLAVSTLAGDRPHLFGLLAARHRIGLVYERDWRSAWKRWSNTRWAWLDDVQTHTVSQNLALADLLGIERLTELIPPNAALPPHFQADALRQSGVAAYAVLHLNPMWTYKRWTAAGWRAVIDALLAKRMHVFISGGPRDAAESAEMADAFAAGVTSLAGRLSFGQLARLISGARLFIGPDTAVTHLAAATGVPTLAIYGPSNPIKWGPWPKGYAGPDSPWRSLARPWQRQHNVLLLQGEDPVGRPACVPCHGEGCDRHKKSLSVCLQSLEVDRVQSAVASLLLESPPSHG